MNFHGLIKSAPFLVKLLGVAAASISVLGVDYYFGREMQGYYAVVVNLIVLFGSFLGLGIPSSCTKEVAKCHQRKDHKEASFFLVLSFLAVNLVFVVLCVPFYYFISIFGILEKDRALVCLSVFLSVNSFLIAYFLRGIGKYIMCVFLTDAARWLFFSVALCYVIVMSWEIDASSLVFLLLCSSFFAFVVSAYNIQKWISDYYVKPKLMSVGAQLLAFIKKSSGFFWGGIFVFLLGQVGVYQVAFYADFNEAGLFNLTNKIVSFSVVFVGVFGVVYGAKASRLAEISSVADLNLMLLRVSGMAMLSCSIILVIIFIFISAFGGYFDLGFGSVALFMGLSCLVLSSYSFAVVFFSMTGKSILVAKFLLPSLLVNLVVNYFLTPDFGAVGAAIADLCGHLCALLSVIYLYYFTRKTWGDTNVGGS